ncbi:peptidase domain-containing ABC transporter [Ornithinicoccus hortensis]|uniref:ABC-type bacteriocin/lantibiotic exporter with double-glycine peptidase domain n=1 Tax=Ornithinicoccus hortensis TaxID=82346 RepID=A0A542YU05_9MICO|nr:peptidase domain-containing ABC transporter [Ornithinicoccus hortensis]TQL51541.1 ABC-type bacteriocin/lantibiotic exporter with double-glycine peptidase domain [Ornithinicoccus hortensis]
MWRTPVHYQSTPTECGVACLAMVSGFHGHHIQVRELRNSLGVGRDGTSLRVLAESARDRGFEAKALRAPIESLGEVTAPFIAHWEGAHYVVVERISGSGVRIIDPAIGRRTLSWAEFDAGYQGVVLQLRPQQVTPRARERGSFFSFIARYVPRSPSHLGAVVGVSLLLVALGILPPLLTKFVVDQIIPSGDAGVVKILLLGLLCFAVANVGSALARSEFLLWLQTVIDIRMMTHFMRHLLSLPYKYFQLRRGGDLLVRASSTAFIRDLLSGQMLAILIDSGLVMVYLAVIALNSWVIALALVAVGMLQVLLIVSTLGRAKLLAERELIAMGDSQSALLETVGGMESIKSSGADRAAFSRWAVAYRRQLDSSVQRRRLDNVVEAVLSGTRIAAPIAVTLLAASLVIMGQMSMGTMLAVSALSGAALAPIGQLGNSLQAMQTVRVHLDRIKDVLDEEPESVGQGDARPVLKGSIELEDVSFAYAQNAPLALDRVNVSVPAGGRVAVVGYSGSGKSTLARVLTGLLPPTSGNVSMDGHPLQSLDLEWLRSQCGVVTQSPSLLSGDIRANITLADPEATDEDVVLAASLACLHDDIVAMPLGYSTPLGDEGVGLSGGQLQRLALARALVHRPRILVLDEATSHLDARTEQQVFGRLRDLACTQVIVAHRLSTVRDADQIVVLHHGEVVDTGTHEELVRRCPHYADLVAHQMDTPAGAENS